MSGATTYYPGSSILLWATFAAVGVGAPLTAWALWERTRVRPRPNNTVVTTDVDYAEKSGAQIRLRETYSKMESVSASQRRAAAAALDGVDAEMARGDLGQAIAQFQQAARSRGHAEGVINLLLPLELQRPHTAELNTLDNRLTSVRARLLARVRQG